MAESNTPVKHDLEALKSEADLMGVKYHPSIGAESLYDKLQEARANPTPEMEKRVQAQEHEELKQECTKLVRISCTCMNGRKKGHQEDPIIVCVSNKVSGDIRKVVPMNGTITHVPYIVYAWLRDKKFMMLGEEKSRNGSRLPVKRLVNEFAVTVLPPLTKEELANLAADQKARNAIQ